jgi:ribonuclease T1
MRIFLGQRVPPVKTLRLALAVAGLLFLAAFTALNAQPQDRGTPHPAIPTIRLADLPPQARETLALIHSGGPFPHARDGSLFANREGLLPAATRGTYREYTVMTPGRKDRGARRIVAVRRGGFYYTEDHYRSFRRIIE